MIASPMITSPTFDEELLGRNFCYVSVEQKLRVFENRESCCYRAHDRLDRLILVFSCQGDSRFEAVLNCNTYLIFAYAVCCNSYAGFSEVFVYYVVPCKDVVCRYRTKLNDANFRKVISA